MTPKSLFGVLVGGACALALTVGMAPPLAHADTGDLTVPRVKAAGSVRPIFVSGDGSTTSDVVARFRGGYWWSGDTGRTWSAAKLPYLACDAADSNCELEADYGRVAGGLVPMVSSNTSEVRTYSLATNAVVATLALSGGQQYEAGAGNLVVAGAEGAPTKSLVAVDTGAVIKTITTPTGYAQRAVTMDGDGSIIVLRTQDGVTGSDLISIPASGDEKTLAHFSSNEPSVDSPTLIDGLFTYLWWDPEAKLCAVGTGAGDPAVSCRATTGLEAGFVVAYGAGVLLMPDGDSLPGYWFARSGLSLGDPVKLNGAKNARVAPVSDSSYPLVARGTASGTELVRLADPKAPAPVVVDEAVVWAPVTGLALTPTALVGTDDRGSDSTAWVRSIGSRVGSERILSTTARGSALASGGRWAVVNGESLKLYDRGALTKTVTGLALADPRRQSGPYLLADIARRTPQTTSPVPVTSIVDPSGKITEVPTSVDIFGGLTLDWVSNGKYRVVDRTGSGIATRSITLPLSDTDEWWYGKALIWGDWVAVEKNPDSGPNQVIAVNYRTNPSKLYTRTGHLEALSEAGAVIWDGEKDTLWNLAQDSLISLPSTGTIGAIDGQRVVLVEDTKLTIRKLGNLPTSAPRLLGITAPRKWARGWKANIDLTKPVKAGHLEIRNAAGKLVRSIAVPASADGSIRAVGWNGKTSAGAQAPADIYSLWLTSAATDGSGKVVRVDGSKGSLGSVVVGTPAVRGAAPKIKGSAVDGQTLTVDISGWKPGGTANSYQWLRNGAPIAKATASSYQLGSADLGAKISVKVTATKASYTSLTKTSAPVGPVLKKLVVTGTPVISGKAVVGQKLKADTAAVTWTPASAQVKYQWLAGGVPIKKATTSSLTLKAAQLGKVITLRITVTAPGYGPVSVTSAATVKVARLP
ncbi:FlgD immunoglobulin-like domain containing protein [Propionicimonas paludicola]|uniref:FlgD immunoglobulin-like domain containing protein n=1 Tax=Propionicimonas paludicola TaxID=185243 RepID=UPI001472B08E|nr:FlgD immunoglobulin-like domain containing protein [Propionicimonas paludicola]